MLKNVMVAVVAAAAAATVTVSCSTQPRDLCVANSVSCAATLACDPEDGICKCGGRGGQVCRTDFNCDVTSRTCVSTRCGRVDCSLQPGTSCDVLDTKCKCGGTGGLECGVEELCNPLRRSCDPRIDCRAVACPRNAICEESSGRCLCGTVECAAGESCRVEGSARSCVADRCFGVNCSGGTACDPADGICKCNQAVCQTGEACGCPDGGAACGSTERACQSASRCAGRVCENNTTCDPTDGVCKCGGPGGPVCQANQLCALGPPARCQGGEQCVNSDGGPRVCKPGFTCDPEDGVCKCGGRGGLVCALDIFNDAGTLIRPEEICIIGLDQVPACRRPCQFGTSECTGGTFCFWDTSARVPGAYCAPDAGPESDDLEGAACTRPMGCLQRRDIPGGGVDRTALHCADLAQGQTGLCRYYCDSTVGSSSACPVIPGVNFTCEAIPGAPSPWGVCKPAG